MTKTKLNKKLGFPPYEVKGVPTSNLSKPESTHPYPSSQEHSFTLVEGATHVGIFNNLGGTFYRFVESFTHVRTSHNTRRVAFTLAEVLITLGIIGIVATMTIPTLINNYKEKVLVNKAKLAFSQVQNAIMMYVAQNHCSDVMCLFNMNYSSEKVRNELATVLKGATVCENTTTSLCKTYGIKYKNRTLINGSIADYGDNFPAGTRRIIMQNGVAIGITQQNNCIQEWEEILRDANGVPTGETILHINDVCAFIYIDSNNIKPPNQFGADVFRYILQSTGKFRLDYIDKVLHNGELDYDEY